MHTNKTFFIALVAVAVPGVASQDDAVAQGAGERRTKPSFYLNFPPGTLAWVPSATTKAKAKNHRIYKVLSGRDCFELPLRDK